jgi:type VI secretion system secreted protein Hcp
MAVDMFLKIEGEDVKGESRDSEHTDEIDVLAWSWGMTQSGSFHVGAGGGSGKVNVQDVSVTKYVDAATPNLMKACASGQHFKKATLTVRKAGGEQMPYLVIEMDKVLVSSVSTGGSGGEDRLTENVTLNFAQVKTTYTPQSDIGGEEGAIEFGWDIEANVSA